MARVVHNLEHGGIYILYGKDVPDSTVEQLRSFYGDHKNGHDHGPASTGSATSSLSARGSWTATRTTDSSRSARPFDKDSVSTFFRSLQFRGPERFDPSQLEPGHVVGRRLVPPGWRNR